MRKHHNDIQDLNPEPVAAENLHLSPPHGSLSYQIVLGLSEMQLVHVSPHKVKLWDKKLQATDDRVVLLVIAHIKKYGVFIPPMVDESNCLLAGQEWLAAAKKLKLKSIPVLRQPHLTKAQKKKLVKRFSSTGGK